MSEKTNTISKKKSFLPGILAVLGIGAAEFLHVYRFCQKVQTGNVISVRIASEQPVAFLMQCIQEFLFPAALLIIFAFLLKKDFLSVMYMKLKGKWQKITALILGVMILGLTVYSLVVKQDKNVILFSLFYYLVIIAFAEEFVIPVPEYCFTAS
jgi:hypothetical protein